MASFTASLVSEYQSLWDSCIVNANRQAVVKGMAAKIAAARSRYDAVGTRLGVPWFAVGLVHALEASLNFNCHLHNGDPLAGRTVHWPTGRPKTGNPPFTWEASATDALTGQGWQKWTDWSVPGLLYRLEAYNGFGYRDNVKPPIETPYLWSFTNHYTSGKYVADGKYSPTTVSQQIGAAALLKTLVQSGAVQLGAGGTGPRTLQLANPHLTGPDVLAAQTLLTTNQFDNFQPGEVDGDFGQITADAVQRAKFALGFPQSAVNGTYGPVLAAYLNGTRPLPAGYQKSRQQRLAAASGEDGIRAKILQWAQWGVTNNPRIGYTLGSSRLSALGTPGTLPLSTDCSGFVTLCYAWAGAPNPNWPGKYDAGQGGYTGTLLKQCKKIPASAVKPGDIVVWTTLAKPDGVHAALVLQPGADPWLINHGDESQPKKIRFSQEDAGQRQSHGGATAVFLSAF